MKIFVTVVGANLLFISALGSGAQDRQAAGVVQSSPPTMPGMSMSGMQATPQTGNTADAAAQSTPAEGKTPELLDTILKRKPRSLEECIQLADANNPTLRQAAAIVRRAEAQARQAALYPNPSVGYQGEQIRGGSYGGGEQGAFVAQTIVLGGKLGLRRNVYEQQKQADQIVAEEQLARVHNDVEQAFYQTLSSQEMVVVRRRMVHLTADAVETAHQLANVGQADAPDILQSEVEAEQAKVDYARAQRIFLQNFQSLAALVGKPDLETTPLTAALVTPPEIDTDRIVQTLIESSPAVKLARQEVSVAVSRWKSAKREAVPDLKVRAGEQFNHELVSIAPRKEVGPQSFASVGMDLPLWNRNQGNIQAAQAEKERAEQNVERVQLSVRQQAAPLVQSYLSAKYEADRYRTELIPRAATAYRLYLKKYRQMAAAYPQVLVSQRTLFQLQENYITALNDVWRNAISLQNMMLAGGLHAPASASLGPTATNLPNTGSTGTE